MCILLATDILIICKLLSYVFPITAQQPQLVLELSANNVTVGGQLNVSCTATISAQSRTLYINGQEAVPLISPQSRLTTLTTPGALTTIWIIDSVQRGDAGEYYCFAGGDQGSNTDSPPQNVTVYCEFQVCCSVCAVCRNANS